MYSIDSMSRTPVYEQLVYQTERLILLNLLPPGSQLPSVRTLSVELSVNPNTIMKAYSELDAKGIIVSVPGKGYFVAENALTVSREARRRKLSDLHSLVSEFAIAGIDRKEILDCVDDAYESIKAYKGGNNT